MSGNTKWFTVWSGNRIDEVHETRTAAKKHAAWLDYTYGYTTWWFKRVTITDPNGDRVSFDDYEFRNGDSRKVS